MAYDSGYTSFWEMKLESAWGTAVTPDVDVGLLEATGSFTENQNVEENYATGSRKNNQLTSGKYGVNGSLTGKMTSGKLLAFALGTDTVTQPSGTYYLHTLAQLDTTDISSFTLGQEFITTDKGFKIAGCRISDFSVSLDTGGILTGTYNWVGKDVTTMATLAANVRTAPTQTLLPSYVGTISWNSIETECKSFTFNYNNTLGDDEYSVGDRRRMALTQGEVKMNGTFTCIFSGLTEYNDFKSTFTTGVEVGTARALSLVCTTGATTTLYELSLGLTNVLLSERTGAIELSNNRVAAEFSFIPKSLGTVTWSDQQSTTYIA